MGRSFLVLPSVHEFLAVLDLVSEIDEDEALAIEVGETEIRYVPKRIRGEMPTVCVEERGGFSDDSIDLGTFQFSGK